MQQLDDVIGDHEITRLNFVKRDIEDSGLLLRGAATVLQYFRPVVYAKTNTACTAPPGHAPDELFTCLLALGYDAQLADEDKLTARRVQRYSAAGN
jgi:hypothetical protein